MTRRLEPWLARRFSQTSQPTEHPRLSSPLASQWTMKVSFMSPCSEAARFWRWTLRKLAEGNYRTTKLIFKFTSTELERWLLKSQCPFLKSLQWLGVARQWTQCSLPLPVSYLFSFCLWTNSHWLLKQLWTPLSSLEQLVSLVQPEQLPKLTQLAISSKLPVLEHTEFRWLSSPQLSKHLSFERMLI